MAASFFDTLIDSQRWKAWLERRVPSKNEVQLKQNQIFIFPTKTGFYFLFVCLLLFLIAINYQNSLVFGLCFLLLSVFIVSMHHCFFNLHGLMISSLSADHCFAGETTDYQLQLNNANKKKHYSLEFYWHQQRKKKERVRCDAVEDTTLVSVPYDCEQRGKVHPGRLNVRTKYPLGLFQAWSWISFSDEILVYPKPEEPSRDLVFSAPESQENSADKIDQEGDFFGYREYQKGDPIKRVDWRSLAKGLPLLSKQYEKPVSSLLLIDVDQYRQLPIEKKLSFACFLSIKAHQEQQGFALQIDGQQTNIGAGLDHLENILKILALYPQSIRSVQSP